VAYSIPLSVISISLLARPMAGHGPTPFRHVSGDARCYSRVLGECGAWGEWAYGGVWGSRTGEQCERVSSALSAQRVRVRVWACASE
jgi:hypothetical protein